MRKSARAIVVKNNRLLVMRRRKEGREYYALIGGGIDSGETPEEALYREVKEETGIEIADHQLVIVQQGGGFGTQYIYLCDYVSGEPMLAADSEEAKIHAGGDNLYQPMWLPIEELPRAALLPAELKQALIERLSTEFPKEPLTLTITA